MVGAQNKLSPFSSCFPIFHLHSSALICGKNFFFPFFSFVLLFQPAKLLPFFNPIASCNNFFALQYSFSSIVTRLKPAPNQGSRAPPTRESATRAKEIAAFHLKFNLLSFTIATNFSKVQRFHSIFSGSGGRASEKFFPVLPGFIPWRSSDNPCFLGL